MSDDLGTRGRAGRADPPDFHRTRQRMQTAIGQVNGGQSPRSDYVSACADVACEMVSELLAALPGFDAWNDAIQDVLAERARQESLWPGQTCANPLPHAVKLAILLEEVGEVAHELTEGLNNMPRGTRDADPVKLRTELVQVAAVAVAWAESIPKP